jgi:hypothetical protein
MLTIPLVKASQLIRTMRGKTRAQLIVAEDGQQYVVKYSNNPVGRRVLVNELISSLLLKDLGIRSPNIACVSLDEEALERNPDIGVESGSCFLPPSPGLHFGCRYAGSNSKTVYDFLPDQMLSRVTNRNDFLGALVFDTWVSNTDLRQAVFYRENVTSSGDAKPNGHWTVEIIGHGSAFQGQEWTFRNSPPQGLYPRLSVYKDDLNVQDLKPWLDRIDGLDAEFFQSLLDAVPAQWIAGEEEQVSTLVWKLQDRRYRLPGLVEQALVYVRDKQGSRPLAVEEGMKRLYPSEEYLAG